ncbi:NUDIX domain-containing protein [Sarocladium implicatum]|nr:NUDIX domain-containing protein [Sarocladium implicatum]
MSAEGSELISTGPLSAEEARWTKLVKTTYKDPKGVQRTWEHAERPTRPATSDIDGVGILALLRTTSSTRIILQKQYRPPLNKICIEIPAGLVDAGETAEEAAVRELREETGYVGVASETSMVMFNDPGFCNTNLRMVHVEIDMEREENKNPKPKLEEGEFIEVFTVELKDLWEECKRLEGEGYAIDARVGNLAEGIAVAQKLRL